MDIKEIKDKVEEVVEKLKNDDALVEQFKKDPIKTVEDLAGVDLPDDQIKKVVSGIQAKLALDDAGDKLGGLLDKLGGLGKKKD